MRRPNCLVLLLALTLAITSCSENGNGNGDPECTTAAQCTGNLPDGCTGYWECIGQKCEPMCTTSCTSPADCQTEEWPTNADCSQSEGQWSCENEVCRVVCPVLTWSARMEVDLNEAGIQLDLQAAPNGGFAIAYYKRHPIPSTCEEPILGGPPTTAIQDTIGYAWYDGSNWSQEDVVTIETAMLSGISLVFRGNSPMIGYLGGAEGRQICGGSDMMISSGGPGNWSHAAAVVMSNEAAAGGDCPKMQSICDFGDVVGLWPSLAKSQDGSIIGVTYRDIHNGYTKDADDCADLEYAYTSGGGWSHEWIDLARGSGDFSSLAFGSDGEPAVAYYNGEVGTGGEAVILFAKRPWAEWTQPLVTDPPCQTAADCPNGQACSGGECLCNIDSHCDSPKLCVENRCSAVIDTIAAGLDEKSISLAVGPDGRYLVAYYNPDDQNLWIAHSEDGLAWQKGIVDADGNTGMYPSIVILPNTNKPAIAYYRCNEPSRDDCNRNHDGPRFAYFKGDYPLDLTSQSKWKKGYVSSSGEADSVAVDGRHISAAVQPDGTIGIAYYYSWVDPGDNSTKEHLMFHKGTWE